MTTRVPIRYGGTGANTAAGARAALGVLANTGGTISGDLTITGNLVVSGNTTTLNTETLMIEDADIVLLSNVTGSPVLNAGITINRGNSTNTFLRWDEGADKWGWSDDGANTYTFDTALSAYSQANAAYGQANAAYSQANAAYTAANNAKVTVFANNSSNVTTQNINFVNTSTVTVTVSADGSNANVAFTAAPQTVVVDTYAASGNTTAAATANIANGLFAIATNAYTQANDANSLANTANNLANSAYAQANSAYTAANNAANTVRVSQNSTSTLSAKQLNFVNTANVTIVVADSGDGNANISFEVASGTGTLSNIGISSNGVFTTNANAFNFVNTSTVSVSVSSGVNGNANIAFNATVVGVNTVIRSETFTSANAAANLTYNILYYPVAVEYVFVNKNGIGLFPTTDYTLSGNTVTIKEAGESGDNIEIRYFVDVSTVPVSNTTIIVEANTVAAQTNTFTLSQNVSTINRLSVTKNGLQLTPNTHYTLANGKTVTLTTLAEIDDQIVFRYFFDLGNIQDVGFTAYQQANAAYDQANLAYTAANNRILKTGDTLTGTLNVQNVTPTSNNTYDLGSSDARFKDLWLSNSTIYLGNVSISSNAGKLIVPAIETSSGINLESQVANAYSQANSSYGQANSAYGQANSAYGQANLAYTQANNAYGQANNAYTQANSAYTQANNAYGQANSAYLQANNAYTAANNSNLKSGGVISGTLNVTNDIIVGGNVYLQGNTTFINVATYQINDALMYIAANNTLTDSVDIGFVGGKNTSGTFTHTGLARDATDGKYKLFDNLLDSGHVGNVIDFANTTLATLVANIESSSILLSGNAVSTNVSVNAAYSQANLAYTQANSAYSAANNRVLKAGDTMTGNLTMTAASPMIRLQESESGGDKRLDLKVNSGGVVFISADQSSQQIAFTTVGTERIRIDSSGNVGIGTTNPSQKLHVSGNLLVNSANPDVGGIYLQATTGNNASAMTFNNGGGNGYVGLDSSAGNRISGVAYALSVWYEQNHPIAFGTNNALRAIITGAGNVGIGTTSPSQKLEVAGTIRGEVLNAYGTTDPASTSPYLFSPTTGALGIGANGSERVRITSDGALVVNNSGGDAQIYLGGTSGTNRMYLARSGADSLLWNAGNGPMRFGTNDTERARIIAAGDIIIGPSATLTSGDIGGTVPGIKLGQSGKILASTNTASGIFYDEPLYLDRMNASGDGIAIVLGRFGYYKAGIGVVRGASVSSAGEMYFATAKASNAGFDERMRITAAGELLVGSTTGFWGASGTAAFYNSGGGKIAVIRDDATIVADELLGSFDFGGTDPSPNNSAYIRAYAGGTWTTSDIPSYLTFGTTPAGSGGASERMRIASDGNVYTPAGSAISYGSGETYQIWSDEPEYSIAHSDANWKDMKTFVCSKSGNLKFKMSMYISSGTYYFGWRIVKNSSTVMVVNSFAGGLDTGESAAVHGYRRFVASVGPIAAGDVLTLQMVSTGGDATPVTGNGQTLYAKEFRAYSTVPNVEHGGSTNIWGTRVGIGTLSPARKLDVYNSTADSKVMIIRRGAQGNEPSLPTAFGKPYLQIGGQEYQSNSLQSIGFGYVIDSTNNPPGEIGFKTTSTSGYTYGDFVIGTRVVTTDTAVTERMRITSGGDVGIGTTSPGNRLHVYNTASADVVLLESTQVFSTLAFKSSTNSSTVTVGIDGAGNAAFENKLAGGILSFVTKTSGGSSAERVRVTSDGKVIIGSTVAPVGNGLAVNSGISSSSTTAIEIQQNTSGAVKAAAAFGVAIQNSGEATNAADLSFHTASGGSLGERMRITTDGHVTIGTTSTSRRFQASFSSSTAYSSTNMETTSLLARFVNPDGTTGNYTGIHFATSNNSDAAIAGVRTADASMALTFGTRHTGNGSIVERARITSDGVLCVGTTDTSPVVNNVKGIAIDGINGVINVSRDGSTPLEVGRKTNDGTLVRFWQDGNLEGDISVSGATVSYNAFAGSHWSQLQDGSKPDILRGTIMETINELCVWSGEENERLPKAKISDTVGSKKVYGVFMAWDNDWTETNDMMITGVGAFICRVNGNVTVQEGDLLESNGDGTARVQADDVIRSSTIGKVTSTVKTHEYDDGSYCVPTVLYCG